MMFSEELRTINLHVVPVRNLDSSGALVRKYGMKIWRSGYLLPSNANTVEVRHLGDPLRKYLPRHVVSSLASLNDVICKR